MSNMQTFRQALKFVASCESLSIAIPFDGACFGHALSKLSELTQQLMIRFMLGYFYSCWKGGEKRFNHVSLGQRKAKRGVKLSWIIDYIHGIWIGREDTISF